VRNYACFEQEEFMTFTAIDFETATGSPNSACAVGIVTVECGEIVEQYSTLIQPPGNTYWRRFTEEIHGIGWRDTLNAPTFADLYPEIRKRLQNRLLVAHFAQFDRDVLQATMAYHNLDYETLALSGWACTCEIYRAKGYKPANLAACCARNDIDLNHHDALSDALACAKLYLLRSV
jgi:DNA polymerase-3 subunit epsilon